MRIMKKYFYNLLTAVTVVVLGMSVTSCSDKIDNPVVIEEDEDAPAVIIDDELTSRGVRTDMESAVIEVPVTCQGEWSAAIPKEDDWLQILDWKVSYSGNQTLQLMIDENTTKKTRESKLMLADNDGNVTNVRVLQSNSVANGAFTTSGSAFSSQGLGCGIDYDYVLNLKNNIAREVSGEPFELFKIRKENNIFNIAQIEKLQKRTVDPLAASAYVEATIPVAHLEAILYDSCLIQDKELMVGMEIGISYGPVSGRAKGEYSSVATETRAVIDYTIVRNSPMYDVYLSPAELSAYADDFGTVDSLAEDRAWKKIDDKIKSFVKKNQRQKVTDVNWRGLTEEQEAIISAMEDQVEGRFDFAGIFSANFTKRYNQLYLALVETTLAGNEPDYDKADQILNALDNEYGPFFMAGATFGGNLTIGTQIHKDSLNGETHLSGEVQAEIGGAVNMSGAIEYSERGFSYLRESTQGIDVFGGNHIETTGGIFKLITGETPSNLNAWANVMDNWVYSMWSGTGDSPQISQAALITLKVTPIWMLFSYPEIQEYAQEYFLKKYKSRGIYGYFGIMNGEYEGGMAEEASNIYSDFWKGATEESEE